MPRLNSKRSHALGERMWEILTGSVVKSVPATAATIKAHALLEVNANEVQESTDDQTDIIGVNGDEAVGVSEEVEFDFGDADVLIGSPVTVLDLLTSRPGGYAAKTIASQVTLLTAETGIGFANQPADDGVEVVSDDEADVGIEVTIYGTEEGDANTIFTETVTLNGTTAVATTKTDWDNILGVELSAECAGTITISEASGSLAITTITTGDLESGVATPATTNAYGDIPRIVADGSSVKTVGLIGTGLDGAALSGADVLTDASEKDFLTTAYATITKVLVGDVENTVDASVLTAEADTNSIGRALETKAAAGITCKAYIPMSLE